MSSFAAADGTRLAYETVGSGPPLVCLPGGPGRAAAYLEDLGGLSQDRTLVLLDPRATGCSELPTDPATLRYDRLAEDVDALRGHLGLAKLDLLAHSAGTLVAQAWAAGEPGRVGRLVLVTPSGRLQGSDRSDVADRIAARRAEPWYAEAREAMDALDDAPPAQRPALMRAIRPFLYARWDERCRTHAESAERQTSRRAELGFHVPDGAASAAGAPAADAAIVAGLPSVEAEVLVVAGEQDALTGVQAAYDVAACFAHGEVVVLEAAGHFPWVDAPKAFRAVVGGFLSRG